MSLSIRFERRFTGRVFSVLMCGGVILSVGCAQGGPSQIVALTAPSALSDGVQVKPEASSDPTGTWNGIVTLSTGDTGFGVLVIVSNGGGIFTGTADGDPGTYTFTRKGNGNGASFDVTIVSPDPGLPGQCGRNISGKAKLHDNQGTMVFEGSGIIDDCSTVGITIDMTRT